MCLRHTAGKRQDGLCIESYSVTLLRRVGFSRVRGDVMDGAIPALGADSMRWLTSVATFNTGNSAHSLQAGLFEQLLNAPPQRFDRQSTSSDASQASYALDTAPRRDSETLSSSTTRANHRDDRQDQQAEDEDQSEGASGTAQPLATLPVPALADGAAADETAADLARAGKNLETADQDTASSDASDGASRAAVAGGEQPEALNPGAPSQGELSAESSSAVADRAGDQTHALQDGAAKVDSTDSVAQVPADASRADVRRAASGATESVDSVSGASAARSDRGQLDNVGEDAGATNAAHKVDAQEDTQVATLDATSSAAEVEQASLRGDNEQLGNANQRAQAEGQAASAGEQSQARDQVEDASARGGKSRDNRREKWFQRDVSSSGAAESKSDHQALDVQSATTAQKFADAGRMQSGTMEAGMAAGMAADNGEGSTGGASAGQSATGAMLPDTIAAPQPTAATASSMTSDSRLMASESPGSALQGGDRQLAQNSVVEAVETSSGQPSSQRADAKPGMPDAQRPDVLTHAERVRLVQRVSRSFARLGPMGGQISLKLHPPQLGALNVQVRLEGRSMTAKLTTESGAARDAIMESLPVLRTRLAEQGFEINSFQVDVADNPADVSSQDRSPGHSQAGSDDLGGRENRQAGQGTDYRRLAVQRQRGGDQGIESTLAPSAATWELPRGVDVEA